MSLANPFTSKFFARRTRIRLATWAGAAALAGASLLVAVTPGVARAATLPPNLAKFANCPVKDLKITLCLYSKTTSTTFEIGSTTVSTTSATKVSLGLIQDGSVFTAVLPDNGTPALVSPSVPLPGGLLGIPGAPAGGPLAVDVTPQLVGVPTVNLFNLLDADGPGLALPIDVLVSTPTGLLGPDCTIGDASDPIIPNLTTGTTNPPSPNTPITGSVGKVHGTNEGETIIKGMSLVDNAFAVPGTDNCGPDGVLDEILDLDKGLPSAAGNNTAILSGDSYAIAASVIRGYIG